MDGIASVGSSRAVSSLYAQRLRYLSRVSAAVSARPAQPELPVEPVSPVRAVKPDAAVRIPIFVPEPALPSVESLNNAADNLVRMRIQYPEESGDDDGTGGIFR